MGKFKVGDRVRCISNSGGGGYTRGREYVVSGAYRGDFGEWRIKTEIDDDGNTDNGWGEDNFVPVAEATGMDVQADKPKFKVGDRVRATRNTDNVEKGATYTVSGYARPTDIGRWVMLDGIRGWSDDGSYLETYFEPATLTIREGHYYLTRDGRKVGPARPSGDTDYPWWVGESTYTDSGSWLGGIEDDHDLVAEAPATDYSSNAAAQVDNLRDEYGPAGSSAAATLSVTITVDVDNVVEKLDAIIGKLRQIDDMASELGINLAA